MPNQLGKLFRVMARVYNRALVPFEVSSVQAHILATLWLEGSMTIGELQGRLLLGSSTLTGAIDRMEKVGLVKRGAVEGDRRAYRLHPVDWPAKKRDALLLTLWQTESDVFRGLAAGERTELGRLLCKALAVYEAEDDDA